MIADLGSNKSQIETVSTTLRILNSFRKTVDNKMKPKLHKKSATLLNIGIITIERLLLIKKMLMKVNGFKT